MEGESENNKKVYWKKKDREKNMQYQENSSDRVQPQEENNLALKVESRKVVFESPDVEVIEIIYIDENGGRKKDYEMVKKQGHSINKNSFAFSNKEKNIMDIIKKNEDLEVREKTPSFNQGNPNMVFTPPSSHPAEEGQVHPKNVIPQHNREHPTMDVPVFIPVDTFIPPKIVKQGDIDVPEEIEGEIRQSRDLDFYPLNEPYAFARIYFNSENQEREYIVIEPPLNNFEKEKLKFIQDVLIKGLDINLEELEEKGAQQYLRENIDRIIRDYEISLDSNSKEKIFYYVVRDFLGYGKIDALMKDPNIEDISCDGPGIPIFLYHRKYGSLKTNIVFEDEEELSAFVIKLAQKCGKHISIAEPMVDATLPDGSRIQMTLSTEVTTKGSTFTIRKFRADPFTPVDLVEFGTMSAEMVAYMWICVEHGANALFAGGTASGKTTSLNALSLFIPPQSKIVSVEETREINLPHPNWIPGLTRIGFGEVVDNRKVGEIDMYDLVKAALRQRPEYIIVGEIRGKEAYVLFQAMATGHTTYSTIHADSPQSLIHRLEGKPIEIPRIMLQSLDLVLFHASVKVRGKRVRRCKQIVEIIGIDPNTKEVLTNEVFRWIPERDQFDYEDPKTLLYKMRREMSGAK
ncbi:secretion system protein E [Euryarchaeota archaeon ex4484_162]|nr:MAG: secretion system protein E [Euryarchaeota archaeon ex4484_162]